MPVLQFWPPLLPQVSMDPLAIDWSDGGVAVLLEGAAEDLGGT